MTDQNKQNSSTVKPSSAADVSSILRHFSKIWELDGDLLRCKSCKNAIVISRINEQFKHKDDCKNNPFLSINPWVILKDLLESC